MSFAAIQLRPGRIVHGSGSIFLKVQVFGVSTRSMSVP
jgi:hypothetical protein